jgi:hypothetical protein
MLGEHGGCAAISSYQCTLSISFVPGLEAFEFVSDFCSSKCGKCESKNFFFFFNFA